MDFVIAHYLAFRSFHIIAVICWMAGLLYLPRLFVYHANATLDGEADMTFKVMEYKLYYYIMHPSMLSAYVSGISLITIQLPMNGWLHGKLVCLLLLTICHIIMGRHLRDFSIGKNIHSSKYFRIFNEVPTALMIIIVILAVTKPF